MELRPTNVIVTSQPNHSTMTSHDDVTSCCCYSSGTNNGHASLSSHCSVFNRPTTGCRFSARDKPEAKIESSPEVACDGLMSVNAHLQAKELWEEFNALGTEMIVTKAGRCVL